MPIQSMTGFARASGQWNTSPWTWEVKSVNSRGLDIRCRLPGGLESLEPVVRERTAKRFRRGSISWVLTVARRDNLGGVRLNREVLDQILSLLPEIREQEPDIGPPSADGLLGLKGVIEPVETELSDDARLELETALIEGMAEAMEALADMRETEGARLLETLDTHLETITDLCARAAESAATQPQAIRERLRLQVAALLEDIPALPEERLAQEVALLAAKGDVREELDRLTAHLEAARALTAEEGAIGRRLDFLCQELNREANTLCSKAAVLDLSRLGLDLKAAIEQFREQVQNIE